MYNEFVTDSTLEELELGAATFPPSVHVHVGVYLPAQCRDWQELQRLFPAGICSLIHLGTGGAQFCSTKRLCWLSLNALGWCLVLQAGVTLGVVSRVCSKLYWRVRESQASYPCLGWKGTSGSSSSTLCHRQGHLPLDWVAPNPVQP